MSLQRQFAALRASGRMPSSLERYFAQLAGSGRGRGGIMPLRRFQAALEKLDLDFTEKVRSWLGFVHVH